LGYLHEEVCYYHPALCRTGCEVYFDAERRLVGVLIVWR
jgi:hypothetical protein